MRHLLFAAVVGAVAASPEVNSEHMILYFELSAYPQVSAETIHQQILKEIPNSDWTLQRTATARRSVLAMGHVPTWFHEALWHFDTKTLGPLEHTNKAVVDAVSAAALMHGSAIAQDKALSIRIYVWIRYCVEALRSVPHWRPMVCGQPHQDHWSLSPESFDNLLLELSLKEHAKLTRAKATANKAPTITGHGA